MQRKDGLTKVFKMFLGDIVYTEKRDKTDKVLVKAIEYQVEDEEFNEIKRDYRGNVQYSTMITKLCSFNPRSEFIIKVITDLLKDKNNKQLIILAHNKNLLAYIFDSIKHNNIATVGYYIGGMKDKNLKESESKKIIVATYAMASEALDIKSLTTLVMVTPKTEITQAVGRILRTKDHNPLIVDIIDQHAVFKKQWNKRRIFYKKQNYKIIYTTKEKYSTDNWEVLYDPDNKKGKGNSTDKDTIIDPNNIVLGKCMINI